MLELKNRKEGVAGLGEEEEEKEEEEEEGSHE